MVRVKICGITNPEDARKVAESGFDAIGFVFSASPRRVNTDTARDIIADLPPFITTVGVFVNEDPAYVRRTVNECKLDAVQLRGDESPEYCEGISSIAKVIKSVRIKDKYSLESLKKYKTSALLVDTYCEAKYGGTGVSFDWNIAIEAKNFKIPIILSGGIGTDNAAEAVKSVKPYAIDCSSKLEKSPGRKDHKLLEKLAEIIGNNRRPGD